MPHLVLLLFLIFCSHWLVAQKKPKLFRAILTTTEGEQIDGILYNLTDSTVVLAANEPEAISALRAGNTTPLVGIDAKTIKKLVIRRKGSTGRGAAIGAGIGMVGSFIIAITLRPVEPTGGAFPIGEFFNTLRLLLIITPPLSGAQSGALMSIKPRKRLILNGNAGLFKGIVPPLRYFAYQPQQQLYGNPATAAPR